MSQTVTPTSISGHVTNPVGQSKEEHLEITRERLQELVNTKSTREVLRELGLSSNSYSSLRSVCDRLAVRLPKRLNQYDPTLTPTRTVSAPYEPHTAPQRHLHKPATRRSVGIERAVVIGDLHVPFHDPKAIAVTLSLIEDLKPEHIYLNGDVIDMYAMSRFSKDPARALQLQDELDQTSEVLNALRKSAKQANIVMVEGNHELRLRSYLCSRAQELSGLRALDLAELLSLTRHGITYIPSRGRTAYTTYGSVTIGHFDKALKHSAYTAKCIVDERGESIVQGHTHRLGTHYKVMPDRTIVGVEGGCLCDLTPEYIADPNWSHGLTIITKRTDDKRFHVTQVPIVGYEALVNDTLYSA